MPRKKSTLTAFGAKKRAKARGRQGGRKRSGAMLKTTTSDTVEEVPTENPSPFEIIEDSVTSLRKLHYFQDESDNNADTKLCPGYRVISVTALHKLVESFACPKCFNKNELRMDERRKGMSSDFSVYCRICDETIVKVSGSDRNESNKTSNINLLTTASAINSGIGYTKLCNFYCGQNLPVPVHLKTFQQLRCTIQNAIEQTLEEHFQAVARIIKQEYGQLAKDADDDNNIVNIAVSYDGSWHKRGHSSLFGVGAVIDLLTGLVIDIAVMSKYCQGCTLAKSDPSKYANHHCQMNYEGSSAAMEVEAALVLFQRSRKKYGLQYLTVLSDGDSKTFLKLKETNVYGDSYPISKEECINHVSKRMGSALRKLKDSSKQSGKNLGGKGRLTNSRIEKIQNYYGRALKDNAPDVEKMRNAAYASLFHMVSTDEEPHHTFCPKGAKSWCHFNRAVVDPTLKKPHKPTLTKEIGEMLLPVYKRLTDLELLQRCTRNKTQNNESLHSVIWQKCPKGSFASHDTVKAASSLAVMQFNKGPKSFFDVLLKLGIPHGKHHKEVAEKTQKRKLSDASRFSSFEAKQQRKKRKISKLKMADMQEEREGVVYEAGGF